MGAKCAQLFCVPTPNDTCARDDVCFESAKHVVVTRVCQASNPEM